MVFMGYKKTHWNHIFVSELKMLYLENFPLNFCLKDAHRLPPVIDQLDILFFINQKIIPKCRSIKSVRSGICFKFQCLCLHQKWKLPALPHWNTDWSVLFPTMKQLQFQCFQMSHSTHCTVVIYCDTNSPRRSIFLPVYDRNSLKIAFAD